METVLSEFEIIDRYSLFIFDLDNTLYDEKDYLFSGYRRIAEVAAGKSGVSKAQEYYNYLKNEFCSQGRQKLFDKFVAYFNLDLSLDDLVNIMHHQQVCIQLHQQAKELLDLLQQKKKKVYILTNGNICQQRNKVRLLRLEECYPDVHAVYASQFEPKPSPKSLLQILKQEGVNGKDALMIGDSACDEETARNANVHYMYIQTLLK